MEMLIDPNQHESILLTALTLFCSPAKRGSIYLRFLFISPAKRGKAFNKCAPPRSGGALIKAAGEARRLNF